MITFVNTVLDLSQPLKDPFCRHCTPICTEYTTHLLVLQLSSVCPRGGAQVVVWVAAIEDALVVLGPSDPAELHLLQGLGVVLTSLHVPELNHLPVGAGGTEAVSHHEAVMAPRTTAKANCSVLSQGVWVKKDSGLSLKTVLDIDHSLILQPRVAREKVLFTLLVRTTNLLVIPKVGQIFLDLNFVG